MTINTKLQDQDKNIVARFLGAAVLSDHLVNESTPSLLADIIGASVVCSPKSTAICTAIRLAIIGAAIVLATQGGVLLALGATVAAAFSAFCILQAVSLAKYFFTKRKIDKQIARTATDLGMNPSDLKLSRQEHLENFRGLATQRGDEPCAHYNNMDNPQELLIQNMMPILRDRKNPQNRNLPTQTCHQEFELLASAWPGHDPKRVRAVADNVLAALRSEG